MALRTSIIATACLGASAALLFLLPLPSGDVFRHSLWVVPWVIWGLLAIDRQLGEPYRPNWYPQAVALVILFLLTLGRRSLGLAATDWFLAAGYFLVLATCVASLLPGLRRLLGRRLTTTPSPAFFLLPLVVYLAISPWTAAHRQPDGDEPYYLLLTHSLIYDLDLDLANNYDDGSWQEFMDRPLEPQPGDPVGEDGEIYSRHNMLLPLLLAPIYRLTGYGGVRLAMAVLTALLAWMVLRLMARRLGSDSTGGAFLAYLLVALAPPLLLYSYQVWIEVPAALLVALALDQIWAPSRTRKGWLILGGAIVLLPLLKIRLALVAGSLLLLAWWRLREGPRAKAFLALGLVGAVGTLLAHNLWRYGNPLKIHQLNELGLLDGAPLTSVRHGLGLLFDPAFGLIPSAPLWLIILPGFILLWRRRDGLVADFLLVAGPYLLALIPRLEWYGGWSPPFRYPLLFLPFLALVASPLLARRHKPLIRSALAALALLTFVLAMIYVVIPGWTYNFADGRTHLLDQASIRLGADVARFFPSAVRPRLATWIWPLAVLVLASSLLWSTSRRISSHWGLVLVLTGAMVVPVAAVHLPNRQVEFEDPWILKSGGGPHPGLWVPARPSYRGSWLIRSRSRVEIPLVPDGDQLTMRLSYRFIHNEPDKPFDIRVLVDGALVDQWRLGPELGWQERMIGPFAWPQGARLIVLGPDEPAPSWRHNAVILDRAELFWR